jgi:hypothetical protein
MKGQKSRTEQRRVGKEKKLYEKLIDKSEVTEEQKRRIRVYVRNMEQGGEKYWYGALLGKKQLELMDELTIDDFVRDKIRYYQGKTCEDDEWQIKFDNMIPLEFTPKYSLRGGCFRVLGKHDSYDSYIKTLQDFHGIDLSRLAGKEIELYGKRLFGKKASTKLFDKYDGSFMDKVRRRKLTEEEYNRFRELIDFAWELSCENLDPDKQAINRLCRFFVV